MSDNYNLQYDEQGRPYFQLPGQARNYVSPVAFGHAAPTGGGAFHLPPQWNQKTGQWETPFDWNKALSIGTGAALGVGALSAAGVIGGAGAGAAATGGGTLPSSAAAATGLTTGATAVAPTTAAAALAGATVPGATGAAMGIGLPNILNLVGLGTQAFTGIFGANKQADAMEKAAQAQLQSNTQALNYMGGVDTRDFNQYLLERARQWAQQNTDRGNTTKVGQYELDSGRTKDQYGLGLQGADEQMKAEQSARDATQFERVWQDYAARQSRLDRFRFGGYDGQGGGVNLAALKPTMALPTVPTLPNAPTLTVDDPNATAVPPPPQSAINDATNGATFTPFPVPGRATGGPMIAGRPYMVGEAGPEMVVPQQSGTVLPNTMSSVAGNDASMPITPMPDVTDGRIPGAVQGPGRMGNADMSIRRLLQQRAQGGNLANDNLMMPEDAPMMSGTPGAPPPVGGGGVDPRNLAAFVGGAARPGVMGGGIPPGQPGGSGLSIDDVRQAMSQGVSPQDMAKRLVAARRGGMGVRGPAGAGMVPTLSTLIRARAVNPSMVPRPQVPATPSSDVPLPSGAVGGYM